MKNLSYLAMLIAILGFILLVGCDGPSNNLVQVPTSDQNEIISLAKSGNYGPSASGQGCLTRDGGDTWRIITFHAVTHPNGTVSGNGMLKKVSSNPNLRIQINFDIDCLVVQDNVAIMMGIVTNASDPSYWVGRHFQFKVIDNGEGANTDTDEITHFANWDPNAPPVDPVPYHPTCGEDLFWDLFPIEAGNIQVRP